MYVSPSGWVCNLSYLEPVKGYMLLRKAGSDFSFFYPVQGGTLAAASFAEASDGILLRSGGGSGEGTGNSQLLNPLQSPVSDNYRFAGNMTIVATVDDDFGLRPGDRLLARVDGELRGRAQVMSLRASGRQRFFLNVSGDEDRESVV